MDSNIFNSLKTQVRKIEVFKKLPNIYFEDWILENLISKNNFVKEEIIKDLQIIYNWVAKFKELSNTNQKTFSKNTPDYFTKDRLKEFLKETCQVLIYNSKDNSFNILMKLSKSQNIDSDFIFNIQKIKKFIFYLNHLILTCNSKVSSVRKPVINVILDLKDTESCNIIKCVTLIRLKIIGNILFK